MRICFISNYFNHHQKALCDSLYTALLDEFVFISTMHMSEERKKLGYGVNNIPSYVKNYFENSGMKKICDEYINQADIVIIGSAPLELVKSRIKNNKLVLRYSERLLKRRIDYFKLPWWGFKWQKYFSYPNVYLLSASAYSYRDYYKIGLFKNRAYRWGYYPETKKYDIGVLMSNKKKNKLLWCGRLIDWKHPDDAIRIAKRLKDSGYTFELDIIGTGIMEDELKQVIIDYGLSGYVRMLGAMSPEQVRVCMENSGIYLFTSDFNEGWGAVLNEAMNSGCAVVASHAIGSVPFLMRHNENGLVYKSGNIEDLYENITFLLDSYEKQHQLGINAYNTIVDLWNAEVAAERLLKLVDEVKDNGSCDLFNQGPCSKACLIKNNWF